MSTCHELSVTWNVFLLKIFSGEEAFEEEIPKRPRSVKRVVELLRI